MKIEFENLSADELRALASMLTQWADLRDKKNKKLEEWRIAAIQNVANNGVVVASGSLGTGRAAFGNTSALANSILQPN